jgi:spermidine/putrescine transport system substrate-binding protein
VVTVTLDNIGKMVAGKLLQPINHSYLTNFEPNVWQSLQSPYYDQESRYTIPYTLYSTGIAWRNDIITDDVAGMENPYDILWDPAYRGQSHLLNGSRDTLSAALLRDGVTDVNTEDPQVLEQAKQTLLEGVEAVNWKYDHTDYNELGQWQVHHTWSGQVAYYQYYLPKGLEIEQISFVWPPRGAAGAPGLVQDDVFAIPRGAQNPVLAHLMIDFLLDDTNGIDNYSYEGFQPPLNAVQPDEIVSMGLVPENLKNIIITEEDFGLGLATLELTPQGTQAWQQIYVDVTGGV